MADLDPSAPARCLLNNCNADVSNNRYAFLVHSQDTLPNNLPPKVDNKPLARQKRRRTSPEDQSLLEAEYEKNPKPDKAARMEIVSRVALGEKEVQIWFQNRRQNTRRKSRPLLPHEIVPSHQQSRSTEALGDTARALADKGQNGSSLNACNTQDNTIPPPTGVMGGEGGPAERKAGVGGSNIYSPHNCHPKLKTSMGVKYRGGAEGIASQGTINDGGQNAAAPEAIPSSRATKPSQEQSYPLTPGLGYISNRRNILSGSVSLPNATLSNSPLPKQDATHNAQLEDDNKPTFSLRRTSSLVRLSLSLDGKAEIVMSEEESPPPLQPINWKAPVTRSGRLQRSKSAVDPTQGSDRYLLGGAPVPVVGRSRDARTWEFYCDSEARSASLTQENSGSAIEAINLLRARKKAPLQTSVNKRNAQIGMQEAPKRLKTTPDWTQKQKLARTTSSLARLQTTNESKMKEPEALDSPGDSDKENWIPGTRRVTGQRRPETPPPKPVENTSNPGRYARDLARPYLVLREVEIEEPKGSADSKPRELRSSSSMSGEEELDCVQNLLSLREGCWR